MSTASREEALARFSAELAALRVECGNPSYARLYRSSAILPPATISDVLRGRSIPRLEFVMAYVQACLDHADASGIPVDPVARSLDSWRGRWRTMREEVDAIGGESAAQRVVGARGGAPWQLPPAPRWLIGREADLAWLDHDGLDGECQLAVLHGPSGVGKTSLAVLWAHHRRSRFPDGALFLDLRGFGPEPPIEPTEGLRFFLTSLGYDAGSLTGDAAELLSLFRTAVADRRMLVVLDNVRDTEQVREVLAVGEHSCVLITSQERLSGLAIREGASHREVAALSEEAAVALLSRPHSQLTEDQARRLARACGYLPLALRIVAEKLDQDPSPEAVEQFLADLETDPLTLVNTDTGDPRSNLDVLFAWALDARSAPERKALLLLADFPGAVFDTYEAAAMIGLRYQTAQRVLAALAGQHLLQGRRSGLFQIHPLLGAWAAAVVSTDVGDEERRAARRRLEGFYLWIADGLDRMLLPQRNRSPLVVDLPKPSSTPHLADRSEALAWLDQHLANFVNAASEPGAGRFAILMPHVLMSYFNLRKPFVRWLALTDAGMAALTEEPDDEDRAVLLVSRGLALRESGRPEEAVQLLQDASEAFDRADDVLGKGVALNNIGSVLIEQERFDEALEALGESLATFEEVGDQFRRAIVLHNLAEIHLDRSDPDEALPLAEEAAAVNLRIGDRLGAAQTMLLVARAHHLLGETGPARKEYAEALEVLREFGDVFGQVEAHRSVADLAEELGDSESAAEHRATAESLNRQVGPSI